MKFATFMSGVAGRTIRVLVGLTLAQIGFLVLPATAVGPVGGIIVGAVGVVVLAAGAFDWCLIAPLLRLPVRGARIRALAAGPSSAK